VVNAPDCGSGIRGFDSHQSPHFKKYDIMITTLMGYSQAVRQRILIPSCEGSIPSSPAICESSSVVEYNLAKVGVAGSNPVFRSKKRWRHSQAVRQRSAKPLPPVRFRLPPPTYMPVWRNWQTRTTQNRVPLECRFDPGHRYQRKL
jgi:hypothetical protein